MANPDRMIAYTAKDFDHMMSMAVAFVRKVVARMIGCEELTIGNPRQYCVHRHTCCIQRAGSHHRLPAKKHQLSNTYVNVTQ